MLSLPQKLEAAVAALVSNLGLSVPVSRNGETIEVDLTVRTGLTQDDKLVPSVTVIAQGGEEFPQGSGNFKITVNVDVKSNADETTLEAHRALCEAALAPVMSDDSDSQLTGAESDFGVMGISNRQCNERIDDRSWLTTLSFDAYCCGLALV